MPNFQKVEDLVEQMLRKYESARDNDHYLCHYVWQLEAQTSLDLMSATELIRRWNLKTLSHPASIARARRRLQYMYPELRGIKYNERHSEELPFIREAMRTPA